MCELIIGAWYKGGSSIIHQNLSSPHSAFIKAKATVSHTARQKPWYSRNQISAEKHRKRGGTEKSTKDRRDLIVSVDERQARQTRMFLSLFLYVCHVWFLSLQPPLLPRFSPHGGFSVAALPIAGVSFLSEQHSLFSGLALWTRPCAAFSDTNIHTQPELFFSPLL